MSAPRKEPESFGDLTGGEKIVVLFELAEQAVNTLRKQAWPRPASPLAPVALPNYQAQALVTAMGHLNLAMIRAYGEGWVDRLAAMAEGETEGPHVH